MVVCSKSCKFSPIRWFFVLFHEMRHFLQLFPEKFIEIKRHGSLLEKLQCFGEIDDFFVLFHELSNFLEPLAEKFIETPKHGSLFEKPSIWPKLCNFSNKVPYLCISMNFSEKSYKRCLISRKSTKNHRFGQNFEAFGTSCHGFAFP